MQLPDVTIEPKWHTRTERNYMHPGELEMLMTLIDSVEPSVTRMIELGVNEGITAAAVLENFPTIERYLGVDVIPEYRFEIPAQTRERPPEPGRLALGFPSFELLLRSQFYDDNNIIGPFDVAFIDGDHGYLAVMKDFVLAKRVVRPGGIIIFHDYQNPTVQVTEALDRLYEGGIHIEHVRGTWLAFCRC